MSDWSFLDDSVSSALDYNFVVGSGTPQYVLANVKETSLKFGLKDASSVSFSLNQLDTIATNIVELVTDLWVYRNGDLIFRGRIGPSQDNLDANSGYVSFTAFDYRGLLGRRFIYDSDTAYWAGEDVATIAKSMLDATQARTSGNLGITTGVGFPTLGVVRTEVEVQVGSSIGSALDDLQESKVRGFDWEVDPLLKLNMYAKRGTTTTKYLEYKGSIKSLTRNYNTDDFANAILASGGDITDPIALESSTLASDIRGRWESESSWPDAETQELLNDRTEYLLEQVNVVPEEYNVDLSEGFWTGRTHIWLGDQITLLINYGRMSIGKVVRVHEVSISPDGNGAEQIQMVLK